MKYSVRMVVSEGAAEVFSRKEWGSYVKAAMEIADEKKLTDIDYMILDGPNRLKIVPPSTKARIVVHLATAPRQEHRTPGFTSPPAWAASPSRRATELMEVFSSDRLAWA